MSNSLLVRDSWNYRPKIDTVCVFASGTSNRLDTLRFWSRQAFLTLNHSRDDTQRTRQKLQNGFRWLWKKLAIVWAKTQFFFLQFLSYKSYMLTLVVDAFRPLRASFPCDKMIKRYFLSPCLTLELRHDKCKLLFPYLHLTWSATLLPRLYNGYGWTPRRSCRR